MASLDEVVALAKTFAAKRGKLTESVKETEEKIAAIRRKNLPLIKRLIATAAEAYDALYSALDSSKSLFSKPRSVVVDGIKVGLQKAKGKLAWDDDAHVVKLIRKHFPEREDELIVTEERPSKAALEKLTASELKKIGVQVVDPVDKPLIKTADSEIDKLVTALFASHGDEELEEAA